MGCNQSKEQVFLNADDSVHRMISHDQKSRSKKGLGTDVQYKPRAQHPALLEQAKINDTNNNTNNANEPSNNNDNNTTNDAAATTDQKQHQQTPSSPEEEDEAPVTDSKQETDRLLYLTKNHGDAVDPYDLALSEQDVSSGEIKD